MVARSEKDVDRIAVRYPLCTLASTCGHRCAAREDFLKVVKKSLFRDEFFRPVFFDGCGEFKKKEK